jgi:hypothetical protein
MNIKTACFYQVRFWRRAELARSFQQLVNNRRAHRINRRLERAGLTVMVAPMNVTGTVEQLAKWRILMNSKHT